MSPDRSGPNPKISAPSNLYTAILALACLVVLATVAYVGFICYTQYGTLLPKP